MEGVVIPPTTDMIERSISQPKRRTAGIRTTRRPTLPWPSDTDFRILAIDGGGIRGILPATVLAELEDRYLDGGSIGDYFDLIAGTSTGGIIAAGLGLGYPARRILELYLRDGATIFPRSYAYRGIPYISAAYFLRDIRDLTRYKYERGPLEKALRSEFGSSLFGESTRRLVIPAFDGFGDVTVFKTPHHEDFREDWEKQMLTVALATSAAPTFFTTYSDGSRQFADGGVWANNPIMLGLVEALTSYDMNRSNVRILSLGCAEGEYRITKGQLGKGGLWHWRNVFSAANHLQSQNALGQAGLLIGRNNIMRVDRSPAGDPIPIDDFHRSAEVLPNVAIELVDELGSDLAEMFLKSKAAPWSAYHGPRANLAG